MQDRYVIRTINGGPLYWNNMYGWSGLINAQMFSYHDTQTLRLPENGEWAPPPIGEIRSNKLATNLKKCRECNALTTSDNTGAWLCAEDGMPIHNVAKCDKWLHKE